MDLPDTSRREKRIRLNAPVSIVMDNGTRVLARLLDMSGSGFRLESEELLHVGERATLHMDGDEPMPVEIRWVTGFVAGGAFSAPTPRVE